MWRTFLPVAFLAVTGLGILAAQSDEKKEEKFKSGPQVGSFLPGACEVFNINGAKGKGRYHCLVCEFAHDPAIMVFVREPEEGKDQVLNTILQKLEESSSKHQESYLHGFVVFLSPQAKSSITEKKVEETDQLIQEAMGRDALKARLEARAEKLKHVVLSYTIPEGPKGYQIHPKAEVTVVFYHKLKVLENFAFEMGKMTEDDVAGIFQKMEKALAQTRKKPASAK